MDFYTYVVDSDLKLNDWLNNTPGNDYTHVYIAPGRWKLDYDRVPRQSEWYLVEYPLLDTIGTKTIEGVSGSVICDDDYEGYLKSGVNLFNYNTLNYTNYIKGITVELNHVESYSGGYIFRKCANVYDCNIINLCHSNDDSNTIRSCEIFFSECINIHDNFIKFGSKPKKAILQLCNSSKKISYISLYSYILSGDFNNKFSPFESFIIGIFLLVLV